MKDAINLDNVLRERKEKSDNIKNGIRDSFFNIAPLDTKISNRSIPLQINDDIVITLLPKTNIAFHNRDPNILKYLESFKSNEDGLRKELKHFLSNYQFKNFYPKSNIGYFDLLGYKKYNTFSNIDVFIENIIKTYNNDLEYRNNSDDITKDPDTIGVLYSGGYDSTVLIETILKNTEYKVLPLISRFNIDLITNGLSCDNLSHKIEDLFRLHNLYLLNNIYNRIYGPKMLTSISFEFSIKSYTQQPSNAFYTGLSHDFLYDNDILAYYMGFIKGDDAISYEKELKALYETAVKFNRGFFYTPLTFKEIRIPPLEFPFKKMQNDEIYDKFQKLNENLYNKYNNCLLSWKTEASNDYIIVKFKYNKDNTKIEKIFLMIIKKSKQNMYNYHFESIKIRNRIGDDFNGIYTVLMIECYVNKMYKIDNENHKLKEIENFDINNIKINEIFKGDEFIDSRDIINNKNVDQVESICDKSDEIIEETEYENKLDSSKTDVEIVKTDDKGVKEALKTFRELYDIFGNIRDKRLKVNKFKEKFDSKTNINAFKSNISHIEVEKTIENLEEIRDFLKKEVKKMEE